MATYVHFDQFIQDVAHKVHDLETDQLTVALSNAAPTTATDAVIADITEVAYTNCSSRDITTTSSAETAGTYKLTLTDLTLTASGGTVGAFRYVVVFNNTPAAPLDPLIMYYDYGSSITLADGESLLIDFSAANGFIQIAPV